VGRRMEILRYVHGATVKTYFKVPLLFVLLSLLQVFIFRM